MGIKNQQLVINAVFEATDRADPVALALEQRGREALREMPPRLQGLPTMQIPLRAFNMVGLPALRALLDDRAAAALARAVSPLAVPSLPPLPSLIDEIAAPGRGLVMVMGKGGVGKTTIAASIAAELASRGHHVHLSTTDPAAHVAATLAGELENLQISRIDPVAETKAYVDRVMATSRRQPRRSGTSPARRGSPLTLLRGGRGLRGLLADRIRGAIELRRPRHGAHRAHAAPPRYATGSYHRQMVASTPTRSTRPAASSLLS